MLKRLWPILLCSSALGQMTGAASVSGNATLLPPNGAVAAISNVVSAVSSTTVEASFSLSYVASGSLACGTSAGTYTNASVDSGVFSGLNGRQIVAGLAPSTTYYCQITATNSSGSGTATFTATTTAAAATTPITGLSFSTPVQYDSINGSNHGCCDTFYNAVSNDSVNYFTNDDTNYWTEGGSPSLSGTSGMSIGKFTSISPLAGITINPLTGYGASSNSSQGTYGSAKDSGLFAMNGYLFMAIGHQINQNMGFTGSAFPQNGAQIIWSPDHGQTWNNFQNLGTFNANGADTFPPTASMFGSSPSNFGSQTFVEYGPDDGTYGYLNQYTQQDNANAYVYTIANEGVWNGGGSAGGGNAFYLARVARAKLSRLQPSDWQFYQGGADGSLDAAWTSTQSNATAIVSNYGELGEPAVNYIPSLNRYVLLTFYYPNGDSNSSGASDCVWLGYEAPHPWGPWTLINTTSWPTQGYYNPVPIMGSGILTGNTATIIFTDSFNGGGYTPYLSTMTIQH